MKKTSIIDGDFFAGWENYIFSESEIKWTGKPKVEPSFKLLENGIYHDVMTGPSSLFLIYCIYLTSVTYAFYEQGYHLSAFSIAFIGFTFPFLIDYLKYVNYSKTKYAISDKYVLFKFYNGWKFKIYAIPKEEIIQVHLTKEVNNFGTITLVTANNVEFSTYHGRTGARRDHPTLEFIENYDEVAALLKKMISSNPVKRLSYQVPMITGIKLKTAKIILAVVFGFMTIYLTDFFILPSKSVTDKGAFMERTIVESNQRGRTKEHDLGGHYQTAKKYSFNTLDYFPDFSNEELELQISPIFKIVKGVKTYRMDYTDRLSSSLNSEFTKYTFLLTYIVIVVGFFTIRKKQIIIAELLGKVVMSAIGFIFVLYLVWRIHN